MRIFLTGLLLLLALVPRAALAQHIETPAEAQARDAAGYAKLQFAFRGQFKLTRLSPPNSSRRRPPRHFSNDRTWVVRCHSLSCSRV
jgi:hypothetical protein